MIEVFEIFGLQSVLILRAAETPADAKVLHGLHE